MLWRCYVSNFMEIGHQEPCQDDPCPPSLSWSQEWWMGLELVRIHQICHGDAKFQISWRLEIRNPVKMTTVLHPGVGVKSDRWVWRWSWSIRNVMEMLCFKFHGDWTKGTLSRRPLSSILELDPKMIDGVIIWVQKWVRGHESFPKRYNTWW